MNKKSVKALLFTIMLFSAISFMTFPKSFPKFISKKDDALVYNIELKNPMYAGTGTAGRLPSSTPKTVHLEFSFKRNPNTLDLTSSENPDTYTITVPNSCVIMKIKANTRYYISSGRVVYYNANPDTVTVTMSCEVQVLKNEDDLRAEIAVYEEINDLKFKYMDFYYEEPVADYPAAELSNVMTFTVPTDGTVLDMYEAYIRWIQNEDPKYPFGYASQTGYKSDVIKYIGKTYFTDADKLLNEVENSTRPGLIISKNENTYTFEIEPNNLVGYARTFALPLNNPKLYFSAINVEEITEKTIVEMNGAFEKYLEYKLYPGDENKEVRTKVMNYLLSQAPQGIYSILNGSVTIEGFAKGDETDELMVSVSDLKKYAEAVVDYRTLQIPVEDKALMESTIRKVLYSIDSNVVSKSMKDYFVKTNNVSKLLNYVTKSASTTEPYVDYMTIYDSTNKHYIFGKIYSNGNDNLAHVQFTGIKVLSGMSYESFNNTTDEFEIVYNYKPSASKIDTVESDVSKVLNEISGFIGNIKSSTITEEVDEAGNKTGIYKIKAVFDKTMPIAYESEIQFNTEEEMKQATVEIINKVDSNIISDELKTTIINDNLLISYTTKNSEVLDLRVKEGKITFTDYISLYDTVNEHYVVFRISSNGLVNKIEIVTFNLLENMEMNFNNTDDNLNIAIKYVPNESQEVTFNDDINSVLNKLSWFVGNMTKKNIEEVLDSENNGTGEFNISLDYKKVPNIDYTAEIEFKTVEEMKAEALLKIDEINNISTTLKETLKANDTFISYVTTNNTETLEKVVFKNYLLLHDENNKDVLIRVSSDGMVNKIEVSILELKENMNLNLIDTDKKIDVEMSYTDTTDEAQDNINFTINELSLFIGRVVNKNIVPEVDDNNVSTGVYKVNFSVNK